MYTVHTRSGSRTPRHNKTHAYSSPSVGPAEPACMKSQRQPSVSAGLYPLNTIFLIYVWLKKYSYKEIHAVQAHVIRGSTVLLINWREV